MNKIYFIGLFCLLYSCTREEIKIEKDLIISEIILGEWEIKESIDVINFGNFEWNALGSPYRVLNFLPDSTYEQFKLDTIFIERLPYSINDQDSIIYLNAGFSSPRKVIYFDENRIDFTGTGREGLFGSRLYRKK